ncbi:MAG: DUF983 domain-containing protein [Puniceicoccaceae bacterium]
MKESRLVLLARGLKSQCPKCLNRDLFRTHYRLRECCPSCGLPLEQEDGWGLGAIPLNYGFTCLFWILPVGLAYLAGWISLSIALVLAGLGAVLVPFLTYRRAKSLWVGIYYAVLPHELESDDNNKKGA